MCRALLYLGSGTLLDNLLFKPDNSLVRQVYMPEMLSSLNLAGFGMKAWDRDSTCPEEPFSYATESLPMFDRNLKNLAEKVQVNCLLAHVRGVPSHTGPAVSRENTHPFCYPGHRISLAHNGDIAGFPAMKEHLVSHVRPSILGQLSGNTDSEWIYALILSQLEDPTGYLDTGELKRAIESVFRLIRDTRSRCGISTSSSANLFVSDGRHVVAVRYCFGFGHYPMDNPDSVHDYHLNYLSLWYTLGREYSYFNGEWQTSGGSDCADTVIISSEPLTKDVTSWLEVPEYSILTAKISDNQTRVSLSYLDL